MARARNIKPGFFTSEQVVSVAYEWRLLFAGLWTIADRDGRLLDRPKTIKMAIFPGDSLDVNAGLEALQDAKLIVRYVVDEIGYIEIPEFLKHQNPHIKEPASQYPSRSGHCSNTVQAQCFNSSDPADSLIPHPSSGVHIKPTADKPPRFDPLSIELPSCISADAWGSWVSYRHTTGKKLTEQTWRAQVSRLSGWSRDGHDPTSIINASIANGWQGLFEPKARGSPGVVGRDESREQASRKLTGRGNENEPRNTYRDITGEAVRVA